MADLLALCATLPAAEACRDAAESEQGWTPTPNRMGDGSPLPPGVDPFTRHATDPRAIVDKSEKLVGYVTVLPSKVPAAAAGKVTETTAEAVAALEATAEPAPEPVEDERLGTTGQIAEEAEKP